MVSTSRDMSDWQQRDAAASSDAIEVQSSLPAPPFSTLPPPPPPPPPQPWTPLFPLTPSSPLSMPGEESSDDAGQAPPSAPESSLPAPFPESSLPAPETAEPTERANPARPSNDRIFVVLGVDSAAVAHRAAMDQALDRCAMHRTVAHLHADPENVRILRSADGGYDLTDAIAAIPTAAGKLIRVAIGGLSRVEVAEVLTSLRDNVDQVLLSGPGQALSQLSIELATLADAALIVDGQPEETERLRNILDQLGLRHLTVSATPRTERRLRPPGHL